MNQRFTLLLRLCLFAVLLAGVILQPQPGKLIASAQESATSNPLTDEQRQAIESVMRDSTSQIWFENNVGQFPAGVRYGFRTTFGAMLVYDDHLQMLTNQTDSTTHAVGVHTVNMSFDNGNAAWQIMPGGLSDVTGSYQNADGTTSHPNIFKELTLRNVYDGIDLRLYSAANGTVEFDWLVARAQDYQKIQTVFTGQDGITYDADGTMTLGLRYQDLTLQMPETYQVINGVKQTITARMVAGDRPNTMHYQLSGKLVADQPLVIDPTIAWSTYIDLEDGTLPFDSYNYAIAVNSNGVYVSGWMRETVTNGSFANYMEVNAGFSQGTATFQNYVYRLNNTGTNITAWTSTGRANNDSGVANQKIDSATNDAAADLELFPDGRVLVGFASGVLQIYSANLSSQSYNAEPVTMDTLNAVAIASNGSFYVSGRVNAATAVASVGPDATFAGGSEGIIIRYSNATTTPTADWATYVGGAGAEYFTAIALTPDLTKLVFVTSSAVAAGPGYPALVNSVDATTGAAATIELLVGVLPEQATVPAAFSVFSYLGDTGNEGTLASNTTAAVVTATNSHFYVAGNSASATLPGITGGAQAINGGGNFDVFVSRIPLNGSAGAGFQSTFLGGANEDNIGGIAFDAAANQLLVFGTTGGGFPVLDTTPASNYYDGTFGGNTWDIFVAILDNTLITKSYATYIGGNQNDYLGQTGDLIGQGHVTYSSATGMSYLATTVHSTLPANAIGTPPGKDITKSNGGNDSHTVFAFNINSYDFGDAPLTYDNGSVANAATSAISTTIRIGTTVDVEAAPVSSANALGDDNSNTGSADDEDGIATLTTLNVGDTTYSQVVSVLNNSGAARTLQGWIDFNSNGTFEASEYTSVSVPANAAQQNATLAWSGLPVLTAGQQFYVRLRLNNAALADNAGTATIDERSIGVGGSGEVEDYLLTVRVGSADLAVTKSNGTTSVGSGSTTTYTLTLINNGPDAANNATLSDPVAASGLTKTAIGACTALGGAVCPTAGAGAGELNIANLEAGTVLVPTLPNGGSISFTVTANVTAAAGGSVTNTFSATPPSGTIDATPGNNSASDTDTVLSANFAITKTDGVVNVNSGGTTTYTVRVTNNGPSTVTGAILSDPAVAGLTKTAVACSGTPGQCTVGTTPTVVQLEGGAFALPALVSGQFYEFTVTATVTATSGTVANTATVTLPAGIDPTPGNNSATDTDTVLLSADLAITKTDGVTSVNSGNATAYTVRVTNNGPSTVTGAILSDVAAVGLTKTGVACSGTPGQCTVGTTPTVVQLEGGAFALPTLASGQFYEITVTANVTAASGTVTNTATVAAPVGATDPTPANNTASDADTVTALVVNKTSSAGGTVNPGATITYTVTMTNNGASTLNNVVLNDALPTGTTYVAQSTTATMTLPAVAATYLDQFGATALNNSNGTANWAGTPWTETNDDGAAGTGVITINVTAGLARFNSGSTVTVYTLTRPVNLSGATAATLTYTLAENGGNTAADTVVVQVSSDGGGSWNTLTTQTANFTTFNGNHNLITPTNYSNANTQIRFVVTGFDGGGTDLTLNDVQIAYTVAATPTIKDNIPAGANADLTSGVPATLVTAADNFDLQAGQTLTVTYQVVVDNPVTGGLTQIINTAAATSVEITTPVQSTTTDNINNSTADLVVTKTDSVAAVDAGGTTTYTLTLTNNGPSAANNSTLSDPAVAGLTKTAIGACTPAGGAVCPTVGAGAGQMNITNLEAGTVVVPTLPNGSSISFTVTANVTATNGTVANTFTSTPPVGTTDPTPATVTDTDNVNPIANLVVTKTDGVVAVDAGGTTTYTLTLTNNGPSAANNSTLSDPAVAGLTKTAIGACTPAGGAVCPTVGVGAGQMNIANLEAGTVIVPTLPNGGSLSFTVTVNVTATNGTVANTFMSTPPGGTTDPTPATVTDTDNVNPIADLVVTKTDGVAAVNAGGTTTYTLTLTNNGPSAANNSTLSDPAVAGLTKTTIGACTPAGGAVCPTVGAGAGQMNITNLEAGTVVVPTLPNGGSISFTVTANVTATNGTVANTFTSTPPGGTTDPTPATVTDTDNVNPIADLVVTKTDGVAAVNAGAATTYTLTLTNNGPSAANNATLSDPAVAGLTKTAIGACTPAGGAVCPTVGAGAGQMNIANLEAGTVVVPTLPSGGSISFTVTANVTAPSGTVANTFTSTPPVGTTDPTPATTTDTDNVNPIADLVVTKTDGVAAVNAGGSTTYTLTLTNNGPSAANNSTLSDPAVAGLTKTAIGACTPAGGAVCPTVGAGAGQMNIANLEAGTVVVPTLPSGGSLSFTVTANVTATNGTVANTFTSTPPVGTTDPTPGNNTATDTDTVTPIADLSITKTDGVAAVNAGGTTTYTIVVSNAGPSDVTGATVTDTFSATITSAAWTCVGAGGGTCTANGTGDINDTVDIPAGGTVTYTVVANISASATGSLVNTATVTEPAGTTDPTLGNNTASDTDTVTPIADLSITKTDGVAAVNAGGTTTYTVRVTNNGPSSVTGAVLSDVAAAGLTKTGVVCSGTPGQCTVGTTPSVAQLEGGAFTLPALTSGQFYEITITANVTALSGTVTNTATIAAPVGTTDPTPGNNSAADTDTVNPIANLVVTKTDGVVAVDAGGTTTYTITLTNNGPSAANNATLSDPAVAGLTKTAIGACTSAGGAVCPTVGVGAGQMNFANLEAGTVVVPTLPNGGSISFTVTADVTATNGTVANTFTSTPPVGTTDPTPATVTDTDNVNPIANLVVTKTDGVAAVDAGGTTTYTLTLTNNGPSAANNSTLSDPAVAGLTKTAIGVCTPAGGAVCPTVGAGAGQMNIANLEAGTVVVPTLPNGGSISFTVTANVTATNGTVANTFTSTPPVGTTDPTPATVTDTDNVNPIADLVVTKTDSVAAVDAGGTTTYTLTLTNNGPSAANNATLSDPVVAGLTKTAIGACTPAGGAVCPTVGAGAGQMNIANLEAGTVIVPTLPNGGSISFTVTASVTATNGTVANTFTSTPPVGTTDPTPATVTDTDTVNPIANLVVTKTDGVTNVQSGTATTYTLTLTNNGPSAANSSTLSDPAVAGLTKTAIGACTPAGGAVCPTVGAGAGQMNITNLEAGTVVVPTLPNGGSISFTVTANVTAANGTVANTFTSTPPVGTIDPTPATTTDTDTVIAINAVNDTGSTVDGTAGGQSFANVLTNDTLNGNPATLATITLTQISTTNPGVTLNPFNGSVNVAPGTPAGNYTVTYQICDQANPTFCDTATVSVPVVVINAVNDTGASVNGYTGGQSLANVLTNDTLNGNPATLANITLTQVSTTNAGVTLNPVDGSVNVAAGTPAGNYTVTYQICDRANPTICDTATVSVPVTAAPINAVDDSAVGVNGLTGATNVLNVFTNDTLNGVAVIPAQVTLTQQPGGDPELTLNPNGSVDVAPNTPAGIYTLSYQICEILNPTNCDIATVTITVVAAPIVANDDDYSATPINGYTGGNAGNAFTNDTLNGVVVTVADITATITTPASDPGVTLNTATGAVTVAAGTPAGTYTIDYQICENLNPTNCDPATITVVVNPAVINAVDDDYSATPINGYTGGNAGNAFTNDTLNGVAVNVADFTATITTPASNPGVTMNTATGAVTVAAGTPAGTYTIDYQICENLNPTNCDPATITVVVNPAVINAVADSAAGVNGLTGATNVLNVFTNDTLNGVAVVPAQVTLTQQPGGDPELTLNPNGSVDVAPNTPAGIYTLNYQICEILNPTNCDIATVTITVVAAPIVANDDDYSATPVNGYTGGNIGNAFTNDTLNGVAVNVADITSTITTPASNPGVTMNIATGAVTVAPNTPAGTYTIDYQICENLNPTNCDPATITVVVNPAVINAVDDSVVGVNGLTGATNVLNVFTNDTLNGVAVIPAEVTLTQQPGGDPELTLNPNGSVDVAPNTPAGTYTLDYQICEILNPTNCDIATVTITVVAAPIVANDDNYSATPINGYTGGNAGNAFTNDTLNGVAVNPANITATITTPASNPGVTMNTTTGAVTVAAGTPAGTYTIDYQICENLNITNCDPATITVVVNPAVINAVNDSAVGVNGLTGATNVLNVFTNDTLNGVAVIPAQVTLTQQPGGDPELTLNPNGSVDVAPNTPAGTYTLDYQICEILNPTNCDIATVTITVNAAVINAVDDIGGPVSGLPGATNVLNVFTNDTLNGVAVIPAQVTLTLQPGGDPELTLNPNGSVDVAPNTPAGTYTLDYQICENLNPTNCDIATVTITVVPVAIVAVDDDYSATPVNGYTGGSAGNAFTNDTLNGVAINVADITATITTPASNPGVAMNIATGAVTVAAGTPAGTYTIDYQICENLNLTNCDPATITVVVAPAVINAVNDSATGINGITGATNVLNIFNNDTLNGVAVIPAEVTLTQQPGGNPELTLNPNGSVDVAPGTAAGTYQLTYEICEVLNPTNCDTAVVSVTVGLPPAPTATDDSTSTPFNTPATLPNITTNDTAFGAGNSIVIATLDLDPAAGQQTSFTDASGNQWSVNTTTGIVTFTPALNFTGVATIPYTVQDAAGQTATANLSVTVAPPASVSGVVFHDVNLDGSKSASEPGIVGVIVNLYDSTGTTLIASTTTGVGGAYSFSNLSAGSYQVVEIDPAGYVSSTANSVPVTLVAGGSGTANFGDYQLPNTALSNISGVVFNDADGNGVQGAGETTLSGVTVELKNNLGVVIATTTTNASGAYAFTNLPAGTYTVVETDLPGYVSTTLNSIAVALSAGTNATLNYGDQTVAGNPLIADPAVTKLGSPTSAVIGDVVVYTITVGNNGNTNATGVVLTDTKPAFLDIIAISISPNPGLTPVISGNTFTINFGTVAPTDFFTITVLTRVNAQGVPPGGVNNAAIVTNSGTDRTFNNASSAPLSIPSTRGGVASALPVTALLPATGFAPNVVTRLPTQPNNMLYAATDLLLEIPRLGVKIPIVGVAKKNGAWDVTWLGKQAGWLEGTAFPSWNGNSVLTGHVYDSNGLPGPFVNLSTLKYGDKIIVHAYGQKYTFEIRTNQIVAPNDISALKHEEKAWLTLVTCKEYDEKTNTYKQRVVVRAILVSVDWDK